MDVKELYHRLFSRYLMYHLLAMAVVVVLLCIGIKYGLDLYTHHGENIEVPKLKGISYKTALQMAAKQQLRLEVTDSGYNRTMPAYAVLAQSPEPGQHVKEGRIIYVTINSPSSPTMVIPDLIDNSSVREAEARLVAMGFRLMPSQEVSGEKDWVYGIVCRGRQVSNGDRLSTDYPLTLQVGRGTIDDMDDINIVDPEMGDVASEVDDYEVVTGPPVNE